MVVGVNDLESSCLSALPVFASLSPLRPDGSETIHNHHLAGASDVEFGKKRFSQNEDCENLALHVLHCPQSGYRRQGTYIRSTGGMA